MKKLFQIVTKKTHLFFIVCILILCVGFFIISCGSGIGPQEKIQNPDRGPYAIDFSNCPGTTCYAIMPSSAFDSTSPDFDVNKMVLNKELTIETWVKSQTTTTSAILGGIFARFDNDGIALYAKDGIAKAAIRRVEFVGTSTATTTATFIVSSGISLADMLWHHIAAVLVNQVHNDDDHPACDDGDSAESQKPHLDIYVDGVFRDCATSRNAATPKPPTLQGFAGEPFTHNISVGVIAAGIDENLDGSVSASETFPGIVDEVRLWGSARSKAQISNCMFQELSLDGSDCGRMRDDLISYMRLNEGTGSSINDWAGLGSGVSETIISLTTSTSTTISWTTGWTTGAPISAND